jgi:hypothetical protein
MQVAFDFDFVERRVLRGDEVMRHRDADTANDKLAPTNYGQ